MCINMKKTLLCDKCQFYNKENKNCKADNNIKTVEEPPKSCKNYLAKDKHIFF